MLGKGFQIPGLRGPPKDPTPWGSRPPPQALYVQLCTPCLGLRLSFPGFQLSERPPEKPCGLLHG